MPEAPWFKPTGVDAVVAAWLDSGVVRPCLAAERLIPAQAARVASIPEGVSAALRGALGRCQIGGVATTLGLYEKLTASPEFEAGGVDTGFLERWLCSPAARSGHPLAARGGHG